MHLKGVGHTISESDLVEKMVGTLPGTYEGVYNQVCSMTNMPTFDKLSNLLLQDKTLMYFRSSVQPEKVDDVAARF